MKRTAKHASYYMSDFFDHLPQEQKKKFLIDRKIKRVHQQFSQCVDPFILEHVNSVYLTKEDHERESDVSRETSFKLTVYVDNSMVAAELNAQRELIVLKYRELFKLMIDDFQIRISRGAYLDNHPFQEQSSQKEKKFRRLTPDEKREIEQATANISDEDIRASFQRALIATKEHFGEE